MKQVEIRRRPVPATAAWPEAFHPLLARVYAARGLVPEDLARQRLADLVAPGSLGGLARACKLLAQAIEANARICVVGDFDCDGATGTAVAVRGLRLLGARNVGYRVPNRAREGYGLSAALVDSLTAADSADVVRPDLILTVDNGIASHAGVAAARERGMRVVVTDHHLPGASLPAADAIVNPNVEGDAFPSKALAGVGVVFYLLLALRGYLRERGWFAPGEKCGQGRPLLDSRDQEDRRNTEPDLASLLDLVALGTVADLVPLDANNRILVAAGLRRIRAGQCAAGITALYRAAKRDPARAIAADLGYALGPRINAAGRLEDMRLGIECLLCDDAARADGLAAQLSAINAQRQELQSAMVEQGEAMVAEFLARHREDELPFGIVLHEPNWHPGVVGLVASKLKERLHRPVVACAPAEDGALELRGSARSIAGFHLRDALAEIDARCPGLIVRFGGHAMAAGLTLAAEGLARFAVEFDAVARQRIDAQALERFAWSDGELAAAEFTPAAAQALRYAGPWGQGFAEPLFDNVFAVESWRAVGERHLKLKLRLDERADTYDAILFDALDCMPPPARVRALFQLDLNDWNGRESLQLLLKQIEPA
ncbi:single-stranded-DNA-specific exonuclease RecJ [Dokdonella sp.]|uniref:single-stranded-DNA-specific exonuclease RecJ n=1 Tax=Dokdonella sp. TaxID=2291710 RepID=UPI001B0AB996|nr:single-stranded-DNA-specific exonuclease RecJ [Dokdonella sp.]MBO9663144.1 single-stranded-DNA-specific exonuclease RecJ [Dokdonella sp.]